ncbi:erythromycin esterase family protein [Paenibacillus sp. UNC499MF]|uniref:erythromycin esterase family protein n=1 Tax=Paenibacillus sp. UNC499MF TaxID=1502751 RepID=UPI0008A06E50|nr:erythromycin esterase family protein [Paenibacillus sp. UNC499MF]SEG59189.1 Erythromycin esterase homolog [Paenibacillus sp. UNC499MF]
MNPNDRPTGQNAYLKELNALFIPLDKTDNLDRMVEAIGDADIVLLGEASHGTSDFYRVRAELSKRLIISKGFNIIGVEGDWPAAYRLNRYVKGMAGADSSAAGALGDFTRWPAWMWANTDIRDFAEWIKAHNAAIHGGGSGRQKVGFYGIDMYSLWESMEAIIGYLEKTESPQLEQARRTYACFDPYGRDHQTYGIAAGLLSESCEDEVIELLKQMQSRRMAHPDNEEELNAEVNMLVTSSSEAYYRTMVRGGPQSWNVRDRHMVDSLKRIMAYYGSSAKAIVWEHNTHIGDARATDMAQEGMVNVGQLLREDPEHRVFAVGFGTYQGEVLAGSSWGAPVEKMTVPPGQPGSWEEYMHRAGRGRDGMVLLSEASSVLQTAIGHRAIGVVYDPNRERFGNYVPSSMKDRYDAFVHLDRTTALQPLPALQPVAEEV